MTNVFPPNSFFDVQVVEMRLCDNGETVYVFKSLCSEDSYQVDGDDHYAEMYVRFGQTSPTPYRVGDTLRCTVGLKERSDTDSIKVTRYTQSDPKYSLISLSES